MYIVLKFLINKPEIENKEEGKERKKWGRKKGREAGREGEGGRKKGKEREISCKVFRSIYYKCNSNILEEVQEEGERMEESTCNPEVSFNC